MRRYSSPIEMVEHEYPWLYWVLARYDYIVAAFVGYGIAMVIMATPTALEGLQNGFPVTNSPHKHTLAEILKIYGAAIVVPIAVYSAKYILYIGERSGENAE